METVDFSALCQRIVFRNAIGYDYADFGRDLGVMVMGDLAPTGDGYSRISYNLSLTNGHLPSIDDNNKSKDVQGVIFYRPLKYFDIKAGYSYGEATGSKCIDGHKHQALNRTVIGAWYNDPSGLDLRAEYGYASAKHNHKHIVKENSAYLLAAYHLGKFLPVVRYEFFRDGVDPSLTAANFDKILGGLTYEPCRHIKLQANYTLTRYSNRQARDTNNGHLTSSQIQLMGVFSF